LKYSSVEDMAKQFRSLVSILFVFKINSNYFRSKLTNQIPSTNTFYPLYPVKWKRRTLKI